MKIIKDCYESIGMFDSRAGDVQIYNKLMIIPVSNIQVDESFELDKTGHIYTYDYAYLVWEEVFLSERDVYFKNEILHQELYRDDSIISYNIYDIELIDFKNPEFQYWNWKIKAKSFFLSIPDYSSFRKEYFENDKLEKKHFYIDKLSSFNIPLLK
jgi:hypothetical protein